MKLRLFTRIEQGGDMLHFDLTLFATNCLLKNLNSYAIKKSALLVLCTLCYCMNTASYAQTEKEIILKYKNALEKTADDNAMQSLELRGDFVIQKLNFPAAIFYKAPNLLRVEMTFQTLTFLQVSNDSLKWDFNPMENENLITRVEKETDGWQNENSTFDFINHDLLKYKELNYRIKFVGKERMDSLDVYVLELSKGKTSETKSKFFINTKSALLYKVEDEKGYRYFANYINNNGFVFPKLIIDSNPKQKIEINFNRLEVNKALPDSLFIIPQRAFDEKSNNENSLDQLLAIGDRFYNNGQYDSANSYYSKVILASGKNHRAFNARGLSKIGQKEYYEAISDFNSAIEINPSGSTFVNNRGLAKFYLGDKEGAIKDYTKALELEPSFAVAFKNRGLAYIHNKNYEQAAQDFSAAIKLKQEDGEAHFKYGVALAQLQKYEEALEAYDLALRNKFGGAEVYNYKGVSEYKMEEYDSAKNSFNKALKLDPDNLQYVENYGRALYELGDHSAASVQFENYLKKQNDQPEIHNLNGLCKYKDENYKGALKDFSKSIELNGSNATYYDNRAAAKEMIEDYEGAIGDYSESIRIYPNDASVFYKRGMIKLLTSKKLEGCLDLATANEMKYEQAKDAIIKNCN